MAGQVVVAARLLGGFELTLPDGTRAGPWERPAARRLLAYLLLRPSRQAGREELAEALFAQLDPERASNAVSKALTMARAALHETTAGRLLEADRAVIRFRPDVAVTVDVEEQTTALTTALASAPGAGRTEALRTALRERLPLLPDEPYAEWVLPVRDELEQLRLDALLEHARTAPPADRGQAWADVAAAAPTNEEACAALLRHYQATRQRDRAVRTFHRCRAALLADLDVEPSRELAALAAEVLRAPVAVPAQQRPAAPTVPVPPGRESLLRTLLGTCEAANRPRAIALGGPAGIGKTHLVGALAQHLEARGWTVLAATAAPDDHLAPYAGLRQLLPQLDAEVAGRLAAALDDPAVGLTQEATRARLAEVLVAALDDAAADGPVAVVLDDAHWSDEAQRAVVARASRGPSRAWLFVVVSRTDEPQASAPELPLETPRFPVPPVAEDAMRALVQGVEPDLPPDVVEQVVQRSAGNPFFGLELARDAQAGGADDEAGPHVPDRIVQLLHRRIATCGPQARRLLPLVALTGPDATYELVLDAGAHESLAGSAEACMRALDELSAAHLLVETRSGLRLLHPLLRDAALTTINPIRRGALHRVLAEVLRAKDAEPAAVARHLLAAFTSARLTDLAVDAAEAGWTAGHLARAVFANEAALELLRGGLDAFSVLTGEDADRLRHKALAAWLDIADIHLDDEDHDAATTAARVAIDLAATDAERASAWAMLGAVAYRVGDFDRQAAVLERGLQSLHGDPASRAKLLSDLGWSRHRAGRLQEARELQLEARAVLETAGDDVLLCRSLDRLGLLLAGDDPQQALELEDRALALARASGGPQLTAVVLLHRAESLSMCDRTDEALVDLDAAAEWFAASRDHYMQSVVEWVRAKVLERHGDRAGALAAREAEVVLLEQVGNAPHLVTAHLHRAELLSGQDAETAFAQACQVAEASGDEALIERVRRAGRLREG